MNYFKFTSFALHLTGLFCSISSMICLFNNDYEIIFDTLILCFPGCILALFFDLLLSTLKISDKE